MNHRRLTGPLRVSVALHESRLLGSGLAVARLLPHLRELGWSFSVWVPGDGPLVEVLRELNVEVTVGAPRSFAFSTARLRSGEGWSLRAHAAYCSAFSEFLRRSQPHVVHMNTLLALPEGTLAMRYGIPVVSHVHELPDPGLKTAFALRMLRTVSTASIAVSPEVASLLEQALPPRMIETIENGVPLAQSRRGRCSSHLVVGAVGSASRRKGTDLFLGLAADLTASDSILRFEHVGDWDAESNQGFLRELRQRADRLIASGVLTVHGEVTDPQPIVNSWDVFVLPSRQDPYPLALLEAMALAIPVIASRVGGISRIVKHGETGILVAPDAPEELSRASVALLADQRQRTRLGLAGQAWVREHSSLELQAAKVSRVYLSALAKRWGPPRRMLSGRTA